MPIDLIQERGNQNWGEKVCVRGGMPIDQIQDGGPQNINF